MSMPAELKIVYDAAVKERDEILAKVKPLESKEADLMAQIKPLQDALTVVRKEKVAIEQPRLAEVSKIISTLAPRATRMTALPNGAKVA